VTTESMTEKTPIVEITSVSKWFPDPANENEHLVSVKDVSLTIPDAEAGEFVVLLGPSGCGKSTLLNMIAGMLTPDAGDVYTFGHAVSGPNPDSVTVPQAYTCFPWLTVLGNVEFGLALRGTAVDDPRARAIDYLKKVGLGDRLAAYPHELSGGMKQRVAIARALATRPKILLMDEPFGALDAQTRVEMQGLLTALWQAEQNTVIFITHDISEALLLADRIIVLSPRPAQIIHDMIVPFPRPRASSLVFAEEFINLSQALLQLLKKAPTSGQVRVSV
jgi:NitT/TauT family transport system ATP-binding protein